MLLVTGINGHTGSYLIEEMKKNNYSGKVRCIVMKNSNVECIEKSGLNYEIIVGDLNDIEFLENVCVGVEDIIHIASIKLSLNILGAAIKNNVKRIICVHTTGMYSRFKMASQEYKEIEEKVIELAKGKINLTILRPTLIYGNLCDNNMVKFIKMIDKMKIYPMIAGGKAEIQPVNARDLGKAYYQVLVNPETTKNKGYNMSGKDVVSIKEMLKIIGKSLNKKTIFIDIPMWASITCAYSLKLVSFGKFDIVEKVLRMNESRCFSHEDAKKDFGYDPMSLAQGIEIEVGQYIDKKSK